jgi:hypothetical protein
VNYGTVAHQLLNALRTLEGVPVASDEERARLDQARRKILAAVAVVRNCHHRGRLT